MVDSSYFFNYLTGSTLHSLRFGLLNRAADGSYTATTSGAIPVQPPDSPSACTTPFNDIAAAWDSDEEEWTVAWMCGGATYLHRVNWNGIPIGSPFLLTWHPSDEPHSGVMLSYNQNVHRFLVQFQHNLRLARRYGESYVCSDRQGNDTDWFQCSSNNISGRVPGSRLQTGGQWATEVDYNPGSYFRLSNRCIDSGGCESGNGTGHGVSYAMRWLDERWISAPSQHPKGWTRESGVVWAATDIGTDTHRYVRAPHTGRTAVLHVQQPISGRYGMVRASWVNEANVAIDK